MIVSLLMQLTTVEQGRTQLSIVGSSPGQFVGRTIEVCGKRGIGRDLGSSPSKRYMWTTTFVSQDGEWGTGIYVDPSHPDFGSDGTDGCIRGIFRRVDGLSEADAIRQGKTVGIVDGINPLYMLYAPPADTPK